MVSTTHLPANNDAPVQGLGSARCRLIALATVNARRQIEGHQRESSSPIERIFKSDNVLVALRTGLELKASVDTKVLVVDLHVPMIAAIAAGQPF
jgi:hypothetical protein